jgi:hypothetical protein
MLITRTSLLTGLVHTQDLPVTEADLARWQAGALIQVVFPALTAAQREFLLTGSTQDEWETYIVEDTEEEG